MKEIIREIEIEATADVEVVIKFWNDDDEVTVASRGSREMVIMFEDLIPLARALERAHALKLEHFPALAKSPLNAPC